VIKSEEDGPTVLPLEPPARGREKLPYRIELWNLLRDDVERVLGRAASAALARAIFLAAQSEYLGRHVVLWRGSQLIAESQSGNPT
jgi:hypothetical protein